MGNLAKQFDVEETCPPAAMLRRTLAGSKSVPHPPPQTNASFRLFHFHFQKHPAWSLLYYHAEVT